mmetsp:Transcript_7059/g.10711  ORF Transcript_7059/g.10711 Transcript_7059/m.10711 type:complete len:294 (+) Transcript_7059:80-961(+)
MSLTSRFISSCKKTALRPIQYGSWIKDGNNRNVFGSYADEYDTHRPFYPKIMWDDIMNDLHDHDDKTAVDMAGGTGRGALELARRGFFRSVLAVDLDANMLARISHAAHREDLTNLNTIQSAAEETPLPSHSVDLIVCLQAFHWFDTIRALEEFHRLLKKPNGVAVVAWNDRNLEVDWIQELESIIERYNPAYDRKMKIAEHVVQDGALFEQSGQLKVDSVKRYANPVKNMTNRAMLDLLWTYSYVRNASFGSDAETAKQFNKEIEELLIRHHGEDSAFDLELICKCYILKPR